MQRVFTKILQNLKFVLIKIFCCVLWTACTYHILYVVACSAAKDKVYLLGKFYKPFALWQCMLCILALLML